MIVIGRMRSWRWKYKIPGSTWPITGELWHHETRTEPRFSLLRSHVSPARCPDWSYPVSTRRPTSAILSKMEGAADQLDQRLVREGLLEEPDRARGYGPLGDTVFLVGGDED